MTECLRKYMIWKPDIALSAVAKVLKSRMEKDKSLMDEWIRMDWTRVTSASYFNMYLEMKTTLIFFEPQVRLSDEQISETSRWLKERYVSWTCERDEEYPEGCSSDVLSDLFRLPNPKPGTHDVKHVQYKIAHTISFIQMAAKVVAVESLFDCDPLKLDQSRLHVILNKQSTEIENECERSKSEAVRLKAQLEAARSEYQQKLDQLTNELQKARTETKQAQDELQELSKHLVSEVPRLQLQIECANSERGVARSEATRLKTQLELVKTDLRQTQKELAESKTELVEARRSQTRLRRINGGLQKNLHSVLKLLRQRDDFLTDELQKAKRKIRPPEKEEVGRRSLLRRYSFRERTYRGYCLVGRIFSASATRDP
eukprot:Gregarina_sp_Pseudo_9__990@NODE_1637_length_1433_cov_65_736011_g1517_i0_p1_GENE_NODE_1637_length_1433_cov_65_736011_g1517_i0NODE_1637_length_1433_cov_65_736011_g1517_i0_p1_ORF_typecomplete_len372_score53_62WEMBL/PF05701_11/6_3e06WEMBL/PF05701_11/9_5e02CCCAP/PF15964_5/8_3e06DUF3584/PF12128_8/0_00038AIP3/PF03915_13/0_00054CCDC144C/PF14915_6/0_00093MAD/PF05557_13/0_0012Filament/PF00038_21/0_032Filament/PF00038_21/0_42LPD39/PF18858_1/0_0011Fez1/PF06818_15/1_4Fez1/PF06818_15/0_014AAA_13/PF13166_6/0_0